jgi:SAM-dependent methyltransferase
LLFGAIYFIPDPIKTIKELHRVVRPNGKVIMSTINPAWHNFNPYAGAYKYFNATELKAVQTGIGFKNVEISAAFPDIPSSNPLVTAVRHAAIKFNLIPSNKRLKEFLKRLFYGQLLPIPEKISEETAPKEPILTLKNDTVLENYIKLYSVATK